MHCCEYKLVQELWKHMESSQKNKNTTIGSSYSTPGYFYPKKTKTLVWKDGCTLLFIAALVTIAKIWKQTKCPLIEEWMKKIRYTHRNNIYL